MRTVEKGTNESNNSDNAVFSGIYMHSDTLPSIFTIATVLYRISYIFNAHIVGSRKIAYCCFIVHDCKLGECPTILTTYIH